MGLIPPFPREAVFSIYREPLYDDVAARELFMAVGRPDSDADKVASVAYRLTELGKMFASGLFDEVQATTPERERAAKRLGAACEKVLAIVGVKDGGEMLPMFGGGGLFAAANIRGEPDGGAATMNALRAVDLLRQDALKMVEIEGRRRTMKKPKAGHPPSVAMQNLVRDLSCLYEEFWERSPGVSNGDVEPSGPLMRLMIDVTDRLKARGLRFSSSKDALRMVWQRLDPVDKMPVTHLMSQAAALGWPAGKSS
jgi:hypothetical protein